MPEDTTRVPVDLEIVKLGVDVELLCNLVSYVAFLGLGRYCSPGGGGRDGRAGGASHACSV